MKIFATDLDGTCILSNRRLQDTSDFIEVDAIRNYKGYMHKNLYENLENYNKEVLFVPVTTRAKHQYKRIRLPIIPTFAFTTNGGVLFVDGKEDTEWYKESLSLIEPVRNMMDIALSCKEAKYIDDLFVVGTFQNNIDMNRFCSEMKNHLDLSLVHIYQVKNKVFLIPKALEKGNCINRLKKKYHIEEVLAAGDTDMDISLLDLADKVIPLEKLQKEGKYHE